MTSWAALRRIKMFLGTVFLLMARGSVQNLGQILNFFSLGERAYLIVPGLAENAGRYGKSDSYALTVQERAFS